MKGYRIITLVTMILMSRSERKVEVQEAEEVCQEEGVEQESASFDCLVALALEY